MNFSQYQRNWAQSLGGEVVQKLGAEITREKKAKIDHLNQHDWLPVCGKHGCWRLCVCLVRFHKPTTFHLPKSMKLQAVRWRKVIFVITFLIIHFICPPVLRSSAVVLFFKWNKTVFCNGPCYINYVSEEKGNNCSATFYPIDLFTCSDLFFLLRFML